MLPSIPTRKIAWTPDVTARGSVFSFQILLEGNLSSLLKWNTFLLKFMISSTVEKRNVTLDHLPQYLAKTLV